MSLWRSTRNEVAGAWRSLRYDMGRRTPEDAPPAPAPVRAPDVTSTGMSTFAGAAAEPHRPEHTGGYVRSPRRVLALSAFGVLAIVGAAGAYFAVVGGLGAVLQPGPAPQPYPLAAAAPTDGPDTEADSVTGLGRGPEPAAPARTAAAHAPAVVLTAPPPARVPAGAPPVEREFPPLPGTPGGDDCDCLTPPVPTPTAPPSPSPTPSADPSPTESEPEPTPTDGPTEWPTAEPSGSGGGGPVRDGHGY
jgi:hypothetical protein